MPKVLAAIREPIEIGNREIVVYGSCGVAIYPLHSHDYSTLCRFADTAMYSAKQNNDSYVIYDKSLEA